MITAYSNIERRLTILVSGVYVRAVGEEQFGNVFMTSPYR